MNLYYICPAEVKKCFSSNWKNNKNTTSQQDSEYCCWACLLSHHSVHLLLTAHTTHLLVLVLAKLCIPGLACALLSTHNLIIPVQLIAAFSQLKAIIWETCLNSLIVIFLAISIRHRLAKILCLSLIFLWHCSRSNFVTLFVLVSSLMLPAQNIQHAKLKGEKFI